MDYQKNNLTVLSKSILKTLLYFDIFQYPLTASEIFYHLHTNHITPDHVKTELIRMSEQSIIYPVLDFFSVQNNLSLGKRRVDGNKMAKQSLLVAQKKALFISKFPFVRAVMASGSLSKDFMDPSSDLDFFIVTKPNRLWTARAILALYKRVFLFNSHKYFCLNYFVDESHLPIEEKNLFTATELATIIPLYGKEHYLQLLNVNSWMKEYLPNHSVRSIENVSSYGSGWLKKKIEALFYLPGGDRLENSLKGLMSRKWKKRYQKSYSKQDFEIAFKVKKHVSKAHQKNHQKKVLDLYQQKLEEFGNKMGINWDE